MHGEDSFGLFFNATCVHLLPPPSPSLPHPLISFSTKSTQGNAISVRRNRPRQRSPRSARRFNLSQTVMSTLGRLQQEEAGGEEKLVSSYNLQYLVRTSPKIKLKKIGQLIVPGGSKKNWGLSSLSLSPREIPPRHLPWGRYRQVC